VIDGLSKIAWFPRRTRVATSMRPGRHTQRSSARLGVLCGVFAFTLLTVGLLALQEDLHPEWRDPEFGYRLHQLKEWKKKAPDRPLILALGSSRIQFGLSPVAMGFADISDEPLVYNFGYQGSLPNLVALNLLRILDAGIRPQCVLIEFVPFSHARFNSSTGSSFSDYLRRWPNRFSLRDVVRMGQLGETIGDNREAGGQWLLGYAKPWYTHRLVMLSHWLPDWLTQSKRVPLSGINQPNDEYGFTQLIENTITDAKRRSNLASVRNVREPFDRELTNLGKIPPISPMMRYLVNRCQLEGIDVIFLWFPESPSFREWFPQFQAIGETYTRELSHEYGVTFFPEANLPDEDFTDGVHLLKEAAERYSRWLAETHLKPWLVAHGYKRR
jgi:hypothetical protein